MGAIVGQHCVNLVGHGFNQGLQEVCRDARKFGRAVDRDK
jgi:hypothetical protein